MNIGGSWGYKSWDEAWKSPETLIRTIVTIAARGGNLLLNVGPDSFGNIPQENVTRLNAIGKWLDANGEAIYGTTRSGFAPAWGEITRKDSESGSTLYLCVFDRPQDGKLVIDKKINVRSGVTLTGGMPLKVSYSKGKTIVNLPEQAADAATSVIKLELRDKLPPVVLTSNTRKYFEIVDQND
jgi:alpha-L-fucosidase